MNCVVHAEKQMTGVYSSVTDYITPFQTLIRRSQLVSTEATVTVFTHGMGDGGKDWYTIDPQNQDLEKFGGLSLAPITNPTVIRLKNNVFVYFIRPKPFFTNFNW